MDTIRKPGSDEAIDSGCTCAVMDNHYGAGRGGDGARFGWYTSGDCPLHGNNGVSRVYDGVRKPGPTEAARKQKGGE